MQENRRIGLVLAGGGAKGAYQLGVWQALRKANLEQLITDVSGTSVGALNACMFAMGNIENCKDVWQTIQRKDVLPFTKEDSERLVQQLFSDFPEFKIKKGFQKTLLRFLSAKLASGIFPREKMREIIENHITDPVLPYQKVQAYATCFSCTEMKSKSFLLNRLPKQEAEAILLASSALPLLFSVENIGNEQFLDGGITDNIPVKILYDTGVRDFIVVHLSRKTAVDRRSFPQARFVEIIPQETLGNFFKGTLNFDRGTIQQHIDQGEKEALDIFSTAVSLDKLFETNKNSSGFVTDSELKERLRLKMLRPLKTYAFQNKDGI
ncbi:patatin-like phospholipase family protein [uncultured Sphaerochaeta sp.]|uniref:patatin-like phospholipase family protein n=1 Tax=uncultured Sphaerochaeta sp. TaxID=886478 RepID=UPI002A0A32F2|nr:patatin-like phospholipase family protein [uncultured Sphaerochaeta sp.]